MSLVIFLLNSDHCPQRTEYSLLMSNLSDFDLCREDFIHCRLKIFYTNVDAFLDKLNEM